MEVKCTGKCLFNYLMIMLFVVFAVVIDAIAIPMWDTMAQEDTMTVFGFNIFVIVCIAYFLLSIKNFEIQLIEKTIIYKNWLGRKKEYTIDQVKEIGPLGGFKGVYVKFKKGKINIYSYYKNSYQVMEQIEEIFKESIKN